MSYKLNKAGKQAPRRRDDDKTVSVSRRFEEACELMKKNAAKFLKDDLHSESSSEDELDNATIIQKTCSQYYESDNGSLRKTRDFLQDILTSGVIVCLICIESVRRTEQIWSCYYCYCILHLHCIQKWAKDSLYHKSTNTEETKDPAIKWCCPKCRSEYTPEKPLKYLCFCGKEENPEFDAWNVPHSCARPCEKRLKPDCGHTCTLLCHPGPCPPCPQTVFASCCCSKSKAVSKRCSDKEWSCGKKCRKVLTCNQHFCEEICHKSICPPCKRQSEQKCLCGSYTECRPCDSPTWQCQKICGKSLTCGYHICKVICHEGPCPDCPNSGPRYCPCQKKVMYLPCTEDVVPCGDTCNKLLECEMHYCSQRCHFGSCEACLQMRVMKCRCGQREKSVPCCKEYICDIKCRRRRDCGRHNCNRKCCVGNCPPCEAPCGRTLNCGSHKCASVCHSGPCYPCRERVSITCNCSVTKVTVPCGRKKSAVPPRCFVDCKLPSDCHHSQRHKHRCHFGLCPPCRLTCGKLLVCGHVCPIKCHSAILTKIETKEKKEGPWDLINSYKMKLICEPCPPCVVPVPVMCVGGHEIQNFPCYESQQTSCGRRCGRKLLCGNHTCALECHKVSSVDLLMQSDECEPCYETCQNPRKQGCSHPCVRPCHPGDCKSCQQRIKMKCHCEINSVYILCSEWNELNVDKQNELMSCGNRCPKEMTCSHRCYLSCHPGPCGNREDCRKKITIRCPCKRKKKEVQCFTQVKCPNVLTCDKECLKVQESQKALELENALKKQAAQEKKQEQELQEFLRKSEGKKRRKKKYNKSDLNSTNFTIYIAIASASLVCIAGLCVFYLQF